MRISPRGPKPTAHGSVYLISHVAGVTHRKAVNAVFAPLLWTSIYRVQMKTEESGLITAGKTAEEVRQEWQHCPYGMESILQCNAHTNKIISENNGLIIIKIFARYSIKLI